VWLFWWAATCSTGKLRGFWLFALAVLVGVAVTGVLRPHSFTWNWYSSHLTWENIAAIGQPAGEDSHRRWDFNRLLNTTGIFAFVVVLSSFLLHWLERAKGFRRTFTGVAAACAVALYLGPMADQWLAAKALKPMVGYSKVVILIVCLGLIEWLSMARIVRGQVLALKEQQFVLAARALGQSHARIILRHLLPNLVGVVVVYLTLTIPAVILDESFLSFLGLGVNDPVASWGSLLSGGKDTINPVKSYWWLLVFPAAAMSVTLLAFNFLGDAIRDALDPRSRR
jgi:ABC-type dipeptide/oligopeptide/nickel transport system permease subunit